MTDYNRDSLDLQDEDRLPWLEAVDDLDEEEGVSLVRLFLLIVAGLLFLGVVIGGIYWLQSIRNGGGEGTLIAAPKSSYKIPAEDPDARTFQGEGDSSFSTSAGMEDAGRIDPSKLPEAPVSTTNVAPANPAAPSTPASKVEAKVADNTKSAPVAQKPAPKAATDGNSMIQLGAYGSKAVAEQAWTALSKRFDYLTGLEKSIASADVNGTTYYRLRAKVASNAQANQFCGKLKVAGENCMAVSQ